MRPWSWAALAACGVALAGREAQAQRSRSIEIRPVAAAPLAGPLEFDPGSSVTWVSDTSVAVLDWSEHQVVVFHVSGREVARLGRSGRGPGEIAGGGPVLASERGEIAVADILLSRVSHFDAHFRFVRSVSVPGMPTNLLAWRGSRVEAAWSVAGPSGGGPTAGTVDLAAGTATPRFSVFRADSVIARPVMNVGGMPITPPMLSSALARDGVWLFARGDQYRIVGIDSSGTVRRTFGRPELPPVYRTPAELQADEEMMDRAMQRTGVTLPPEAAQTVRDARRELLRRPKPFLTSGLAVDQLGRVWIGANRGTGDSSEVDVFSPRGEFLQPVVFPHRVRALAFRLPRVVVVSQYKGGEYDEQCEIRVYTVSGGETGAAPSRRD